MSGKEEKLNVEELSKRGESEVRSLLTSKSDELRKTRFKHAMKQLRETHVLGQLRRDIAKLNTVLTGFKAQQGAEQKT